MPRNIRLTIEYDGTDFNGWQIQPKGVRTIQGEITKALTTIFKEKTRLIGSGRTDAGVHALGQVANFHTKSLMSLREIRNALNANLPPDVAILKVEEVPLEFHSQYSVKSKAYRYTILYREVRPAQQRHFCLFYRNKLNFQKMRGEAKVFVGCKDFKSFQSANKSNPTETVRTIKRVDIKKRGEYIFIEVEANGFLYKMVRNIVGTLLEIGSGKLSKGSIKQILSKKNRIYAGPTAKPQGLALLNVVYS